MFQLWPPEQDLRITLVWTDPPASVGSTEALIHDLDLVVIAQSTGTEYYPNGLEEADAVNNVEKITITDTTEGESYTIRVGRDFGVLQKVFSLFCQLCFSGCAF